MEYFQDFMPENVCFGCGINNDQGLHVKSYWQGDESVCYWTPKQQHHGWEGLLNGGIIATIMDCHCMCTAMAYAYRVEKRPLGSAPEYRYATGTLQVKYLAPTCIGSVTLRAQVLEMKGRKMVLKCDMYAGDTHTATAEIVAIRVYDSSEEKISAFKSGNK